MKFIDSHVHYDAKQYDDRNTLIPEVLKETKYIINCATNTKSINTTISLCKQYNEIYGVIGYFPCDVLELEKNPDKYDNLYQKAKYNKIVAIGEIGLDYHWESVGYGKNKIIGKEAIELQKKWFIKQIELANKLKLPICVHSRDAEQDTLEILQKHKPLYGCVIHCYSYGLESAKAYQELGFYFGIGGTSTYKSNKELREVIKNVPMSQIVLETDGPYLTPEPNRRKRNDSRQIKYVIENISKVKNIDYEEIVSITNNNIKNIYKIGE